MLEQAVDTAVDAIDCILASGIDRAMNQYNTKKKERKKEEKEDAE